MTGAGSRGRPGPRVVAFDLGGVLVDVDHAILAARLGAPVEQVEAAFFGEGLHDRVTVGDIDGEGFVREAARRLGVEVARARDAWAAMVVPMPGADDLVRSVPLPCAPWSNTDPIHYARIGGGIPSLCGGPRRCVSYEIGAAKPDPEFYLRSCACLGVAPEDVLFLDDREDNVAAARAVGVDARRVLGIDEAGRVLQGALQFA